MNRHPLLVSTLAAISLLLTWLVYQPGLPGPFLFDDTPNLEKIGSLGPIENWELFKAYLQGGFAGPTGRPISLASFLINTNDWPADPAPFKYTNLLFHLLIGAILFQATRLLLGSIGRPSRESDWIALIAASLWLLNPFLLSTTLYVVQRMTQLTTLFCIIAIWGYLRGRLLLSKRPTIGYVTITLSLLCGTLLATFSKENGALLPTLILTIEFALGPHWVQRGPSWQWKTVFLGLPTLAILTYLSLRLPGLYRPIPTREFTLFERLLTEPRILWDYLFHLVVPHIQTSGLYQDGRTVSTGFTTPWTTLPALLGAAALGVAGLAARHRWPLVSLATLFFLAGHLLESTTITLELYFEHRNYLPAILLFVPVGAGLLALRSRLKPALLTLIITALIGSYAIATWERAKIWGNEPELMLVWAETNPQSARAQTAAIQTWLRLGQYEKAVALQNRAMKSLPDSALLTANSLLLKSELGILTPGALSDAATRLHHQPFDAQILQALKHIVERLNAQAPQAQHTPIMMSLLSGVRDDLQGRVPIAHRYTYYLQGLLLSGQGEAERAYEYLSQALYLDPNVESGLHMVSVLATYDHLSQAEKMLNEVAQILARQSDDSLARRRQTYEDEIDRLRQTLNHDLIETPRGQEPSF